MAERGDSQAPQTQPPQSQPPESDRRGRDRVLVCVAAEVETADKTSLALIRNVSASGALLLAARGIDVGEEVELCIHTTAQPDGPKIITRAEVVRREPLKSHRTDLWRHELGVRFLAPLEGYDEQLASLTAQLKR
jgi:hypothetical protein